MSKLTYSLLVGTSLLLLASALVGQPVGAAPSSGSVVVGGEGGLAQAPAPPAPAPPPPVDQTQITYLRECMGKGAAANKRSAYCQCSYQQIRRRYTPQQYDQMDALIRGGPPELRRFAVLAWDPEFALCRPLLPKGAPGATSQDRLPAASK